MPSHFLSQPDRLFDLPWIEFGRPAWLALLPALWLVAWWIARGALGGWRGGRQAAYLVLRCIVLGLLCVALAEPSIRRTARDVAVVVVRDVSGSIPADQQPLADEFIAQSLQRKVPTDRLGVVTAARDALVQSLPAPGHARTEIGYVGDRTATNLQSAIQLARSVIPSDAGGRVLVISDGNQTSGSLADAVAAAQAAGVPIDVASVEYDRSGMVRVQDVVVPAWARENDTVNARVIVESGRGLQGRLSVMVNGEAVDLDPDSEGLSSRVAVSPGLNVFGVPLRLGSVPVHQIEAVLEPERGPDAGDGGIDVPELLRATGVTFTSSRGRILVVTEDAASLAPFLDAIRSDDLVVETAPAAGAPSSLTELAGYDAVVLANEPASSFSQAQQEDLVRFVHDAGGGLLVLGGPDSYGAGGWIGSTLADALPVLLDPPQKRQMPMGSLALIIDCSGSMGAQVSGTRLNQQQVANEAAILGVKALSRLDQVAVIAFSGDAEVVVPLTLCSDPDGIARRIRTIGPGGGTNLFPAIDAAASELAKSPAGVKHVVILTDGQTIGDPEYGLSKAARLRRQGVTLSTVAIGDGSNDGLLQRLAMVGGGRSYTVTSAGSLAALPQIFIKEAQTVRRTLIWEGPAFSPRVAIAEDSLRGLSGPLPGTSGYVVTADRGGLSTVLLRGPQGDPILAQWQHGLGRVTAFTSDATTRWNAPWIEWGSYRAFWRQQLHWAMRPTGDPRARVGVQTSADRARITVELFDENGQRLNFASVAGRIMHPASASGSPGDAEDVVLRQVGPGRYEGEVDAAGVGVHVVSLRYGVVQSDGSSRQGAIRAAVVRRGGDELRRPTPDTELLWQVARRTNGRIYSLDSRGANLWVRDHVAMPAASRAIWVLAALAGIAALLADVAARRVAIDGDRLRAWAIGLFAATPLKKHDSLPSLSAAKARASESMQHGPGLPARAPDTPRPPGGVPPRGDPVIGPVDVPPVPSNTALRGDSASDGDMMARLRAAKRRSQRE